MEFRQFYLGCLSHASYYLGSEAEAAVIDPQRDVDQYLAEAEAHGQKIKYIIETHSHADFVSGHVELAARTGAEIVYGRRAETKFPTLKVKDGDELSVGEVRLRFLETPGHTPEGITVVAEERSADTLVRMSAKHEESVGAGIADADRSVRAPKHEEPPQRRGWYRHGGLPHFDGEVAQFITFRLADSLPKDVLLRLKAELENDQITEPSEEYRQRVEDYLDRGAGECILRIRKVALIVSSVILHEAESTIELYGWVIMPNHVHLLLRLRKGHDLAGVMKRIKGVSARKINQLLGRNGKVWQADYFDRYIRDGKHFAATLGYIKRNPVVARLSSTFDEWEFGGVLAASGDADKSVRAPKIFTGDTLFIGDVGRPDLVGSVGFTAEEMAAMLYDSLHEKILPLPDETEVYPAHGAGSLCGKSLSKETWSTLGEQRRTNYALQPMSKDEFVKLVASDQPTVPMYFPKSAAKNLEGSVSLADIAAPRELKTDDVLAFEGVVIDVRQNFEYGAGHIPGSINIGLGGQFASWAGALIPIGTRLAIVAEKQEQVDEAVMRLARVGHETVTGFILIENYGGEKKVIEQVPVEEMDNLTQTEKFVQFVDVRRAGEYETAHAYRAQNIPLDRLADDLGRLDIASPTYVICQGGYRSSAATSILENAGFKTVYNVTGGTAAWLAAGLPTGEFWME